MFHLGRAQFRKLGDEREQRVVGSPIGRCRELLSAEWTDSDAFRAVVADAVTTRTSERDHGGGVFPPTDRAALMSDST